MCDIARALSLHSDENHCQIMMLGVGGGDATTLCSGPPWLQLCITVQILNVWPLGVFR